MNPFTRVTGPVMPLLRPDVDTDQIVPARFLSRVERTGYGEYLFDRWRTDGDFVLNDRRYAGAPILLAGPNFGCGSSREHAVWALMDYGFRAVIAPSFSDIFTSNCFQNGLLPVTQPVETVDRVAGCAAQDDRYRVTVNLETETVSDTSGLESPFEIESFRREALLRGVDAIALTLRHEAAISQFEQNRDMEPWL